jgi:hypothetical protein
MRSVGTSHSKKLVVSGNITVQNIQSGRITQYREDRGLRLFQRHASRRVVEIGIEIGFQVHPDLVSVEAGGNCLVDQVSLERALVVEDRCCIREK